MFDTMKMFVLEGTPAQLADFAKSMGANGPAVAATLPSTAPEHKDLPVAKEVEEDDGMIVVTTEFARKFLSRRPLSKEQRKLLVSLAKASPDWTLATALQKTLEYTPSQFAGMMGAFGRRLTHTPHFVFDSWFFDQEWVDEAGCYRYRLPETVIAALKAEKII